ncbi:hypothetical protein AAC387_Pa04g1333 [Persea americana]
MASSSASNQLLLANITILVSVKLDKGNYLLWHSQFEPILYGSDLYKFVDGSSQCLEQFLKDSTGKETSNINPAFTAWRKQDQMLVSWLKATLAELVLAQVTRLKSAYDIWQSLAHQYATRSRSRKAQLRLQLQTLKKGIASITEYLNHAKNVADSLASIDCPVSEDELVLAILGGLPKDYNPLYVHVTSQRDPVTVDKLHCLLLGHEMRLESRIVEESLLEKPSSTLFTPKKNN